MIFKETDQLSAKELQYLSVQFRRLLPLLNMLAGCFSFFMLRFIGEDIWCEMKMQISAFLPTSFIFRTVTNIKTQITAEHKDRTSLLKG